ncbi:biotin/lipoyl-binding protein [Klebsiella pneumoniae]|uniref:biotin/lipoyl-binding protein n=1 Tax=Klebsiella pneumoniae TaxID=573 RepID=UPI003975983C
MDHFFRDLLFDRRDHVGCDKPEEQREEAPAREVDVLSVKTEPFTVFAELPGASSRCVSPRCARGWRDRAQAHLRGRADVKAGDVLFQIDPAPFKAALSRAEGELARAEAQLFELRRWFAVTNHW